MKIGDWLFDTRSGHVFKIEKIWGEWVLQDDYIDSGDVSLLDECRRATKGEIRKAKRKRKRKLLLERTA